MPLKSALQVELELLFSIQLSVHKNVQYDLVKGETEVASYAVLEDASKTLF